MWSHFPREDQHQMGRVYLPKLKHRVLLDIVPHISIQLIHFFPEANVKAIWRDGLLIRRFVDGIEEEAMVELSLTSDALNLSGSQSKLGTKGRETDAVDTGAMKSSTEDMTLIRVGQTKKHYKLEVQVRVPRTYTEDMTTTRMKHR